MRKLNLHPLTGQPVLPIGKTKSGKLIWPVMGGDDTVTPAGTVDAATGTITVPVAAEAPATQTFTAEQVEAFRKQERDKLYPQLETLKQQAAAFEAFKQEAEASKQTAAEAAAKKAREEAEAEARKRWEEQDSKTLLAEAQQTWEQKFAAIEAERQQERALFAREQEFSGLQNHIQRRVTEVQGDGSVAPELVDLINGNTVEEVEASITTLQTKTAAILENVQQAAIVARSQMRGVSPAGYSTSGPMDVTSGTRTFSQADIANMSMADYAKHRNALLGAASAQQNRGLFG